MQLYHNISYNAKLITFQKLYFVPFVFKF